MVCRLIHKKGSIIHLNVKTEDECYIDDDEIEICHRRLDHASYDAINKMLKDGRLANGK